MGTTDMLVGLTDMKLNTWLYPSTVFIDKDLLPLTIMTTNAQDAGKYAELMNFSGSHVTLRRADGSKCALYISPYPTLLYQLHDKGTGTKRFDSAGREAPGDVGDGSGDVDARSGAQHGGDCARGNRPSGQGALHRSRQQAPRRSAQVGRARAAVPET